MSNYLLSESMTNTIVLYIILKKLMEDFKDWDAYKLGIIDADGKKLKKPVSSKEREAWDLLTRFCWNFKKVIVKFLGKSKSTTYLSAAYLLKDNLNYFYISHNQFQLNKSLLNEMTFTKQNDIYQIIQKINNIHKHSNINEDNFEFEMYRLIPKVESLFNDIDIEKVIY